MDSDKAGQGAVVQTVEATAPGKDDKRRPLPRLVGVDLNARLALSLAEAAETLGVSQKTLERRRDDGSLRCFKMGKGWKIRMTELQAYLRKLEAESA